MSLLVNIEHEVIHLKHKQEKFKHKHEHDLKHYHGDNEATHNLRRLIAEREEHITTFNRMFKVINFLAGMLHHKVPEQHNHDFEKLHHELKQCNYDMRNLAEAQALLAKIYAEVKKDMGHSAHAHA